MPVMDGYVLTRRLRLHERKHGRRTPVIALTANVLSGEADKCRDAGMDDYLSKPVVLNALREKIEHHLGPSRPSAVKVVHQPAPAEQKAAPAEAGALDLRQLESVFGSRDAVDGMLADYLEASANDLQALEQALRQGRVVEAGEIGHRMKGAARIIGADQLAGICAELERAGSNGRSELVGDLFEQLRSGLAQIEALVAARHQAA